MKRFHITLSLGRLFTGLAALVIMLGVSVHSGNQPAIAATNHAPTGNFSALSCAYSGSYSFAISARWDDSDADAIGDPANAYLGNKSSTGNPATALGISYNGPTHTWSLTQATLPDSAWPVKLFVHDVGNPTSNTWTQVAIAYKPACPAPPAPPAPPTNPAPAPVRTVPKSSTPVRSGSAAAAPSAPAPASDANGVVTTGTTAASIVIPAGGASKLHIAYGLVNGPAVATDDQPVSGDSATIVLTGLNAKADYTFQIIRTNSSGVSSFSAAAGFSTKGYNVQLAFTDSKKKPVSGISGGINDQHNTNAKSDKNGKLTFNDLPDGSYTVAYNYKGTAYTKDFDTSSDTSPAVNDDGTPRTITLSDALNVDKLSTSKSASPASGGHSVFKTVLLVLFLLALLVGGFWFFWRRRHNQQLSDEYSALGTPAASPDALDQMPAGTPSVSAVNTHTGTSPLPSHAGESLRDMVLESMREQHQLPGQQEPVAEVPFPSLPSQPAPVPLPPLPSLPTDLSGTGQSQATPAPLPPSPQQPLPTIHEDSDGGETLQISHKQ